MPRTQHSLNKLQALQMVVRNVLTLSSAELDDLIEDETALVADDENGDYTVMRGRMDGKETG